MCVSGHFGRSINRLPGWSCFTLTGARQPPPPPPCTHSSLPVDDGDALVRLVSEQLDQGKDWRKLQLQLPKPAPKQPAPRAKAAPPTAASRNKMKKQQAKKGFGITKAASTSDAPQLEGTTQKRCSWQAYVTEKMHNVAYPDLQAIYQVSKTRPACHWIRRTCLVMTMSYQQTPPTRLDVYIYIQVLVLQRIGELNIFRIKGKFPTKGTRYFSFQSNNKDVRASLSA